MAAGTHAVGGRVAESNFRLERPGFAGRSPGALGVFSDTLGGVTQVAELVRLAGVEPATLGLEVRALRWPDLQIFRRDRGVGSSGAGCGRVRAVAGLCAW